jgi:hypothetical protein
LKGTPVRGWSAQVSAAALTLPEFTTPYDAKKVTASIGQTGGNRLTAWMFAFGQNREIHGNLEAYLFEATLRAGSKGHIYTRAESAAKDILTPASTRAASFIVIVSRRLAR